MASTLFDLTGKVALITGSSKGIGRAIAEEMARHGAQVVISSRKADVCQEVADAINKELADEAGGATVIPAHIGRKEDLQELVDKTRAALGKIDVLVCNAAVNPYYGSMRDLPDEAFDHFRHQHQVEPLVSEHGAAGNDRTQRRLDYHCIQCWWYEGESSTRCLLHFQGCRCTNGA